jgi:DNA-binding MarR family transcriptional regulator
MDYRKIMSRFSNAQTQVNASYEMIAKKYGLTYNALMILYIIDEEKNISDALYLSKSTVHSVLLGLKKQNYVDLAEGDNKKEKFVFLTPQGELFFSAIRKETEIFEKAVLDFIGEDEVSLFLEKSECIADFMVTKATEITVGGDRVEC